MTIISKKDAVMNSPTLITLGSGFPHHVGKLMAFPLAPWVE
jgi:hypothetical protein